jgi:hypothetical protein
MLKETILIYSLLSLKQHIFIFAIFLHNGFQISKRPTGRLCLSGSKSNCTSTRHGTDTGQKALATPTHLQSSTRSLGKRAITDITCGGYATAGEDFLDCDSNETSTNNI